MKQHVVAQTVGSDGIVEVITLESIPVVGELFRAEHEHGLVSIFVVLYDGERGKSFAEPDAVGENATVELLELIDDREDGVALKIVEHRPNLAVFETGRLVGQNVFGNVVEKFVEDVVERHKINQGGRIFGADGREIFDDGFGDVFEILIVIPQRVERSEENIGRGRLDSIDEIIHVIAALAAEIDAGKTVQRRVGNSIGFGLDEGKADHKFVGDVGFEGCASTDPLDAISSDGALGQFVAKFKLKFRAVETPLAIEFRDIKFALRLIVKRLDEGRRRKNKSEVGGAVELFFECVVSVNRKARGGDGNFTAASKKFFHVVADGTRHVVEHDRNHEIISKVYRECTARMRYTKVAAVDFIRRLK